MMTILEAVLKFRMQKQNQFGKIGSINWAKKSRHSNYAKGIPRTGHTTPKKSASGHNTVHG